MNKKAIPFIKAYKKAESEKVEVKFMDAKAMAGYYLFNYNNALAAIDDDMSTLRVPYTTGRTSKIYIAAVQKED